MRAALRFFDRLFARKFVLPSLLLIFFIAGEIASLQPGLTIDDATEEVTFRKITSAAEHLLSGDRTEFEQLKTYGDRYYGIGFDLFAVPFQYALRPHLMRWLRVDSETALLLGMHPAVFVLFAASIIAFYRCARLFIRERSIATWASAVYASCPYLFGHSMINVRDAPFMSLYLICTWLSLRVVKRRLYGSAGVRPADLIALACATAALTSVRMPGLMILVQYAFTFALAAFLIKRADGISFFRWQNLLSFFGVLIPLVVLVFPAVWVDPIGELFAGLKFVGWYYQTGCTLTWGKCLEAYATPGYLAAWFAVKLPLVIAAGVLLAPFALKRLWRDLIQRIAYLSFAFGSVYVIVVIVALRSHLYDETRQLLFIYPLLFLLGLIAIYKIARGAALFAALLCVALFAWDQVRLHPYQYVYFNEFGRFLDLDRQFETDYWGTSAREHAALLERNFSGAENDACLYADPVFAYRAFLPARICVESLEPAEKPRRDFTIAITCSPNRIVVPPTCARLSAVTRTFPLSNRIVTLSVAYGCAR